MFFKVHVVWKPLYSQKFFPSYIGSVFWGVKCGTQQFYSICKKLALPY